MEQESEESHLNKKVKKSASVRFAPERSPSSLALTALGGNHAQDADIDIRAELHNYLPSNTLHRRKHTVFTPTTFKSLTIPRKNDLGHTLTFNRVRHLSSTAKKRTFLPKSVDTSDLSSEVSLIQTSPEQIDIPVTEEEKIDELINIRNLPIPLSEKKLYRMDNDGFNISLEDIDVRLARFEEDRTSGDNRICHSYNENCSDVKQDYDSNKNFKHSVLSDSLGRQRSHEKQRQFGDSHTKENEDIFLEKQSGRLNSRYNNKYIACEEQLAHSSRDRMSFNTVLKKHPKKSHDRPEEHRAESLLREKRSYLLADERSETPRNKFAKQNEFYSSYSDTCLPPENSSYLSKCLDYKGNSHNNFSTSELCLDEFKTSRKLSADFIGNQNRQYEMSTSKVKDSLREDRWSPQDKDVQESKILVGTDHRLLSFNTDLEHKNAETFRHVEDIKFVQSYSGGKQKALASCKTNIVDNMHYTEERTRQNNFLKNSDYNNYTEKPSCSYFGTDYDVDCAGDRESAKYCRPRSYLSHKKRYITADHERENSEGNILSWDCYGVKPKYQFQNNKHKLPESSLRSIKSDSEYHDSDIYLQKKYDANKYLKIEENVSNIRRRQINNEGTAKIFVTPTDIDLQRRNERFTIGTFTMHDARKIAPLVRSRPANENCTENRIADFEIINDDSWFKNKRKCWSRICWSKTKHSHAYLKSLDRNAIVNSMRSPQYATKAKKQAFSDCCSSLLKGASSRLQLWNRTLKKIEGQFGTGVVSYFVFLRWLILLNFVIFLLYLLLIILPYSVLSLLPHRHPKGAPNETLLTSEFLDQFAKNTDEPYSSKRTRTRNVSLYLNEDLLSNLGTLLESNVPNEILDLTLRYDKRNHTGEERSQHSSYCKDRYEKEMANHTKGTFSFFQDFLQGTGWLQSTILFLGFYPDRDVSFFGLPYNLPVSFVAVLVVSFFLSLVLMLQYSSHGIQESILTRKSSYLTFSNILFCSWDYCIEDRKTAAIRHKSITGEIKSNLTEEHRKLEVSRWSSEKRFKVYMLRIVINIVVIAALFGCFYLIYKVVNFQLEKQRQNALKVAGVYTLFIQFLPPLVITGLNILMPVIFYNVAKFEMYATQTQVNIALFRIVFLRLASVFVLVSSLYQQITCEPKDKCKAGMSKFCRSPICWETYVGQQLYKLVIIDFLVYIFMFLAYDLPRDLIVQKCRCKVTEVVGRQVFDIPSQVLSLVYSQTLCWLGLFYSPLLPGISVLKFFIIFYIKKVVVLKHCIPAPVLYKASRSNAIFVTILMISLFFATVIHGYSLTSIEPSPGCGPFQKYDIMINAVAEAIADWSPPLVTVMTVLFSGFFFIPAFILLSVVIYYYWTVVVAHRKMIKVLKAQIAIEGRDKQFLLNRLSEAAKRVTTTN